jgi:hypothetical protein
MVKHTTITHNKCRIFHNNVNAFEGLEENLSLQMKQLQRGSG